MCVYGKVSSRVQWFMVPCALHEPFVLLRSLTLSTTLCCPHHPRPHLSHEFMVHGPVGAVRCRLHFALGLGSDRTLSYKSIKCSTLVLWRLDLVAHTPQVSRLHAHAAHIHVKVHPDTLVLSKKPRNELQQDV